MLIHGCMIVRNEGSRTIHGRNIFEEVLDQMGMLCNTLTVLDDDSEDDTKKVVRNHWLNTAHDEGFGYDLHFIESENSRWGTDEKALRQELFLETIDHVEHNDWIICLDADELFVNEHLAYIKYLMLSLSTQIRGIGFRLFDMWNDTQYRFDKFWKANIYPWCMAIRYDKNIDYKFNNKKLHCGRFPENSASHMLPTQIPIQHWGWATKEDRQKKYDRYMKVDPKGEHGILEQYNSILDENPNLIDFGRCPIK